MLELLRARLQGDAIIPGDAGYNAGRQAWNLHIQQHPAVVVMVESAADVREAVRFAAAEELGVGVMATGHGTGAVCNGGVLINTSRLRGVEIDPVAQMARVEAGALWRDLIPLAQEHGLAGLAGSSSGVGVVGFTMGGGLGWLSRKYGLNAGGIRAAEMVTADGELVRVTPDEYPELFWGLGGGAGNFGIVTSLEFALYPLSSIYGGNLFYPITQAPAVLDFYAEWSATLPDEMASGIAFLNLPPLPIVPEPLRGKSVIAVRGCYCGEDLATGDALMAKWRARGRPIMETLAEMPVTAIDAISMDPVDPMPGIQSSDLLGKLTPAAIAALLDVAGEGSSSPLIMLELRQLGGALRRTADRLFPLGAGDAHFLMNGVGAVFAPEMAIAIRHHLERVAEATRPYQTGGTYINFLEADYATSSRVRASYDPADWARLVALKDRYDPENRFRFNRNIAPSR